MAAADEDKRDGSGAPRGDRTLTLAGSRVEEELRKQSEWLRVTIASIGDGVISTDEQGRVTLMNGVAEHLTGWTQAEAAGRPLVEVFTIVHERTRAAVDNPALRALREGRGVELANHTLLISRDGTERPIDDSAAPMRDANGTAIGAVLVFRDVSERKRAEEARSRLAAIVASSQDAIVSKGLDGTIRTWNGAAERLFGYTAEQAIGQNITLIIPPDRRDEERAIIERIFRGERVEHFETVRVRQDGRQVHISLSVSPLWDDQGEVIGASKIARDITAQKAAEQERQRLQREVEEERARLAEAFQHAPSFLTVVRGPDHIFELANERYFELIGDRDIIGLPVREALPEVIDQGFIDLLDRVYRTGEPFIARGVRILIQRDPQLPADELFLEFVFQPLRDADGRVSGIVAQGVDLTERKRAEAALARVRAESERRRRLYETILSHVPDFVYIFSLDHRILYANEALLKMWGYSWDQTIGKSFIDVGYEPWHAEMHCREIDEVRSTRRPVRGEIPFTGQHGRRIYEYIFVPVFGADGEVEAVAGTTRDITERRQLEDTLREADRNKDEFIALLAHELRNPLAPLRNGLQVMQLGHGNAEVMAETRSMMERQLVHMVRLVDDLLDISRLSQNKMELRRDRILLSDVISSAVETARATIESAGHQLTVSLPPEPIYLDADLTRLAQVFSNLLSNSAKYTEDGGQIWLTVQVHDAAVSIAVKDTGTGIPPESLTRVFEMFSQVDRSIERSSGGLGIGLALVKALVEKHGGTVTADSPGQGHGSTFTVTLPILPSGEPAAATEAAGSAASSTPPRRVLVVDDNRDSAQSMAVMLKLVGNEVAVAHDGVEAVEITASFQPDVILMDVGMPRLNGHDATRYIRAQHSGRAIRIIALTGWGQAADRASSKAAGCDGHLVKPVSLAELDALLAQLDAPDTLPPNA